jgi:hypothetical protein
MRHTLKLAAAVLATAALAGLNASVASAEEQFSFPSPNGASVVATTPQFAPITPQAGAAPTFAGALALNAPGVSEKVPLPIYAAPNSRMDARSHDAFAYHLLTHALSSQAFSNYAADYYRLFAPNYAVTAWTERVAGVVEVGYGSAVDSWTGGAYYLGRVRGSNARRNAPPDLSKMPTFRPHPELETAPTFKK